MRIRHMECLPEPAQRVKEWHVVHCRPFQETQVARLLQERLALATYLPTVKRRFRGQIQSAPLFPCYLFVDLNRQGVGLSRINSTPGVLRLLTLGDIPQTVPNDVIVELRERVEALNVYGGLLSYRFRLGDAVRLKQGPLSSLDAIFQGPVQPSERVRILIELLGRPHELQVSADLLEPAQSSPPFRLERRTRGRGRAIRSERAWPTATGDKEGREVY
jgi:transcriptional antiterminator RfaH